jgi:hypothetical protein
MNRGRFIRIVLKSRVLTALLTTLYLLSIPSPLHAQSGQATVSGLDEHAIETYRPVDRAFPITDADCGFAVESSLSPVIHDGTGLFIGEPSSIFGVRYAIAPACSDSSFIPRQLLNRSLKPEPLTKADGPASNSVQPSDVKSRTSIAAGVNRGIYYKNKLEFSLDAGWLPINIPFAFDFLLGGGYTMAPLKYTLVPIIASLRWQLDDPAGPWIFRGNWDLSFSGSVTPIPRGPETRYFSYIMGIRRNFVPHREKVAPYFDGRLGLGNIDAKGPKGAAYAQGQDFTFTLNLGSGVRYNFNNRYSVSVGMNYMHISNLYLSEPRYRNYGINVYGPMVGMDIRLGRQHRDITP